MQRIQDVANIYGGIAGAMPGSPTQQFQPTPLATGIGGGLSAAYMLGMGRDNTQAAQVTMSKIQNYGILEQSSLHMIPILGLNVLIMYNRILKRPMFKRGGSSFQSQGTGITSPYDTPRKRYNVGTTYEDIYSQIRETTKDPRGDFSYAAQGFGHLGSPYKESGEAKMISEMLAEGAGAVRGSREKASELERTGELSILESQGGRLAAKKLTTLK